MAQRFPQEAVLRNGSRVLIRPFTDRDTEALWQFFHRLPQEVRRLAWDNIDDRAVVERWGHNIDYFKALPLIALDGDDRIVADATLHRRKGGPLRMNGRVKWLLDPEYRGLGLGTILVNYFISMAKENGLHHLTCMLFADVEADAVQTLADLGFERHLFPGYGTDPDGGRHDMVKLTLRC
jgi:GNAT superfamily N-acetyltransferase